jgi:hypothetical protein
MKIQSFIFNWPGQTDKTKQKESEISKQCPEINLIVINSDIDHQESHWINLNSDAYFTEQFQKALSLFRDDSDILFHVQGDASY